jgi:hypothetical protein
VLEVWLEVLDVWLEVLEELEVEEELPWPPVLLR